LLEELRESLKEQLKYLFGVVGASGKMLMCSDKSQEASDFAHFQELTNSTKEKTYIKGLIFTKIKSVKNTQYFVFIEDFGKEAEAFLDLLALYVKDYLKANTEKTDKLFFLKQILKEELSLEEIENRNKIFKLNDNEKKTVITFRSQEDSNGAITQVLRNLFHDKKDVLVVRMNKDDVVVFMPIKNLEDKESEDSQKYKVLKSIIATLEEQLLISIRVALGSNFYHLADGARSYVTSLRAFDLGSFNEEGVRVYNYNEMGVSRLFHEIEKEKLEEFAEQAIPSEIYDKIDEETIKTMQIFFDNNLNISETARKMYLHRNTLVYRIEKFNKLTDLDITKFSSASLFDTVCKIKNYLKNMEKA